MSTSIYFGLERKHSDLEILLFTNTSIAQTIMNTKPTLVNLSKTRTNEPVTPFSKITC